MAIVRHSMAGKSITSLHSQKAEVTHYQTYGLYNGKTTWPSLTENLAVLSLRKETKTNVSNLLLSRFRVASHDNGMFFQVAVFQRCNLFLS